MLNHKNLAIMANRLQVPVIISDILDGKGELTDDVQYGLHELISDFQPDTALLSIAMGARKIAVIHKDASASTKVLEAECTRIINEYGSLWLKNAQHENIEPEDLIDILIHTAEDLESLAELLDMNECFLRIKDNGTAAMLCEVLYVQAKSHAMIAEAFLAAADAKLEQTQSDISAAPAVITDNIIQFPAG